MFLLAIPETVSYKNQKCLLGPSFQYKLTCPNTFWGKKAGGVVSRVLVNQKICASPPDLKCHSSGTVSHLPAERLSWIPFWFSTEACPLSFKPTHTSCHLPELPCSPHSRCVSRDQHGLLLCWCSQRPTFTAAR